ncbi:hypothetical protein MOD14_10525 [Bacillus haynesii]|uniref:hypothetical protein n=1 Tax=Bacillus haynesii TaxID=1925021 RepID=UPI002280734E|nr:hypothetical protein [Bacillus haynesii]MCY8354602.1 hypothetical protein [Bacillus haynesii]
MAELIENREKFFAEYNIKEEKFNETGLKWSELREVYDDYLNHYHFLKNTGETVAEILRTHPATHSVRMRIKDPEHLIEKLIRKKIKDHKFSFDVNNYREKITDLIGLRVLHLFKEDAKSIDPFIRELWDLHETAIIYYRKGDFKDEEVSKGMKSESPNGIEEEEKLFVYKEHPFGYRSWHYLILTNLTKEKYIAEIQVRTIFEEGWSEIDHKLRYPYNLDNEILNNQLMVLNRLAGSADEMVNSIVETVDQFNKLNKENEESKNEISQLRKKIGKMKGVKDDDKQSIIDSLNKIEGIHQIALPEIFKAAEAIERATRDLNLNEIEKVTKNFEMFSWNKALSSDKNLTLKLSGSNSSKEK